MTTPRSESFRRPLDISSPGGHRSASIGMGVVATVLPTHGVKGIRKDESAISRFRFYGLKGNRGRDNKRNKSQLYI